MSRAPRVKLVSLAQEGTRVNLDLQANPDRLDQMGRWGQEDLMDSRVSLDQEVNKVREKKTL